MSACFTALGKIEKLQVNTSNEDGTLLVTWDPPDNPGNCSIFEYGVWVEFKRIKSCNKSEVIDVQWYKTNTTKIILDGLQSYSEYEVSVKPVLKYGGNYAGSILSTGTTKAVSKIKLLSCKTSISLYSHMSHLPSYSFQC